MCPEQLQGPASTLSSNKQAGHPSALSHLCLLASLWPVGLAAARSSAHLPGEQRPTTGSTHDPHTLTYQQHSLQGGHLGPQGLVLGTPQQTELRSPSRQRGISWAPPRHQYFDFTRACGVCPEPPRKTQTKTSQGQATSRGPQPCQSLVVARGQTQALSEAGKKLVT